ncbi:Acyl-CoA synthetase (AMP-forming)/AMP-acid ligase II [Streptomyces sp. DvalAA-14]|uniref:AMP-binding protein n=1 Tax=unclassified Streptomyces TaxID=2593676 RepID=UPI00081AF436|nr:MULTISPECIES: AMP-binding protein [unclassified Streptomyces]MYS20383.1 AMP-binding protein [Streptomyces sp. SID4948]SCD67800.1 Acyl-CoA synthetase (AMP-forming)/AMP-acid ligase II [Streptomyces sp. DvalAA-14]
MSAAADTLPAVLDEAARRDGSRRLVFPEAGQSCTVAELARRSALFADVLHTREVGRDEVVGLLAEPGAAFFTAFFGVLRHGSAATAMPALTGLGSARAQAERLAPLVDTTRMRHLVVSPELAACAEQLRQLRPALRLIAMDQAGTVERADHSDPAALAVVQFTSGSTSAPRGVTLTHAAAVRGVEALARACQVTRDDVWVNWLPHYHDFGLVTDLVQLFHGGDLHVLSPLTLIRRPRAFLEYVAASGGTCLAGPNFCYQRMAEVADPDWITTLDLSRLRLCLNGAEPVQPETLERFARAVEAAGAPRHVLCPGYGLAEATLVAALSVPGTPPRIAYVHREYLAAGRIERVPAGDRAAKALVSAGRPVDSVRTRVIDGDGKPCPEGALGEIQLRGDSLTTGYLHDEAVTAASFDGPWLRTGDLGFLLDGHLFIAGRSKEMIIVRGVNYFPEDAEAVARTVAGVHRERCVAFAMHPTEPDEHLMLVAESAAEDPAEHARLAREIAGRISEHLGLTAVEVRIVPPRWLPRTTSGKWRRGAARDRLLAQAPPTGGR